MRKHGSLRPNLDHARVSQDPKLSTISASSSWEERLLWSSVRSRPNGSSTVFTRSQVHSALDARALGSLHSPPQVAARNWHNVRTMISVDISKRINRLLWFLFTCLPLLLSSFNDGCANKKMIIPICVCRVCFVIRQKSDSLFVV